MNYRPSHQVHWIQAKRSIEEDQLVIDLSIVVHDDVSGTNLCTAGTQSGCVGATISTCNSASHWHRGADARLP